MTHHRTLTVQAEHERLADLLRRAALPVSAMDFESQLRHYEPRPYPAGGAEPAGTDAEPRWEDYAPAEPPAADPDGPPPDGCWTPATSASWPRPGSPTSGPCGSGAPGRPRPAARPGTRPGAPTNRPSRPGPGPCGSTTTAWRSAAGRTGWPSRPRWSRCWSGPWPPPRRPPRTCPRPAGRSSAR
ncbi:hypothetical protein ACFQ0M_18815 [Kitasatospora aburaviensis]